MDQVHIARRKLDTITGPSLWAVTHAPSRWNREPGRPKNLP